MINLQNFGQPGSSLKDISILVNECGRLFDEMKNDKTFNFECFRQNSYCKIGNVGKYISKNFRDYIFKGDVDPRYEGLILTLYYTDESAPDARVSRSNAQKPIVIVNSANPEGVPIKSRGPQHFFMAKPEISEEDGHETENYMSGYRYE